MKNVSTPSISSFSIIKGSLIEETYAAFQSWDLSQSKSENLRHIREQNRVGAKSSSWLQDITRCIGCRFEPEGKDRSLVILAQKGCEREVWKPILLWHRAQNEFLVRDFLTEWLYQRYREGPYRLRTEDVVLYIKGLSKRKDIQPPPSWTESTIARVSSGLLRMAVDFGLMAGKVTREFISYPLPEHSFLYLLHAMSEVERSPRGVIESSDWHLYLMGCVDVERELLRLHQFHKLRYDVAGSIVELALPCDSSVDYVRTVLV